MKKVFYFQYRNSIYPVVIKTNNVLQKIDILHPDQNNIQDISRGKAYGAKETLYSVIYSKTGTIRYYFGNEFILTKILEQLSKSEKVMFLLNLTLEKPVDTEDIKLYILSSNANTIGITKTNSLWYLDGNGKQIVEKSKLVYNSVKIKNLDYFIAEKELHLENKDYKAIRTYEGLQEYIDSEDWSQIEYTAKDTETTGLRFYYGISNPDEIVGMSHSYKDFQGVYIVFKYMGEKELDPVKVFEMMKPMLVCKQIWQNGPFDDRVFRTYGIREKFDYELMDVFQLTNPDKSSKALKDNAKILLNEDTIELDEILGKNFDAHLTEYIPIDLMTVYACSDTDYTRRIFILLTERLSKATRELLDKDTKNTNIISAANWYGFPADIVYLKKLLEDTKEDKKRVTDFILAYVYKEYTIRYAKELLEMNGAPPELITEENILKLTENDEFKETVSKKFMGVRSPVLDLEYDGDKQKILYTILNYPKLRMTKSGNKLSTGKDYFIDLTKYVEDSYVDRMKDSVYATNVEEGDENYVLISRDTVNTLVFPVAYMLMQYAIVSNKYKNYKRIIDAYENGRSFSDYRFAQTSTGRITNGIQTLPGYAKQGVGMPQESDMGLIIFDFDQIELRAAHNEAIALWENMKTLDSVKNNPNNFINKYDYKEFVDMFNNFESDVHTEMASRFTKLPVNKISTTVRKKYKETTFAGLYGGGATTMGRKELAKAKNLEERKRIIMDYEEAQNTWMSTDIHLYNYFEVSKNLALKKIPEELIPFNMKSKEVGMSRARSGRNRFFDLSDMSASKAHKISNQGRNQPLQGLCYDIYFQAISQLEDALRAEGFTDKEVRSIIFVHDEDGLEYNKHLINPLWLTAMIFKYCCISIESHPINYYCTPAVVCNWSQGKSDKYEIPKGMLQKLSTNKDDYEILDTMKHDEYVLQKIAEYYQEEMLDYIKSHLGENNTVELSSIDFSKRFKFVKNAKMYMQGKTKLGDDGFYDTMVNLIYPLRDKVDFEITLNGNIIDLEASTTDFTPEEKEDWDDDIFAEFDMDNFNDDVQNVNELLSYTDMVDSVINKATLDELNKKNTNIDNIIVKYSPRNIICEEFTDRIIFLLNKNEDGILSRDSFDKIQSLLSDLSSPIGRIVHYMIDYDMVVTPIKIPFNFKVEKFDKFITSLRTK